MSKANNLRRISAFALLLGLAIPSGGFAAPQESDNQQQKSSKAPMLTDSIRCTVKHALGCNWQKADCIDGDSVLEDISGGSATFYQLDPVKRIARLKGKDEQDVLVQILRIGFAPDLGIVNVQGFNEGWMPWTLSYQLSSGKGFVTETTPEFTSLYVVSCEVLGNAE